jgi:hypothetical protein
MAHGALKIKIAFWALRPTSTNKKERMEEKNKEKIFYGRGGSHISCVLHQSGTPLGSHPHVTLLQENPLLWEPPLQHNTYQLLHFIL